MAPHRANNKNNGPSTGGVRGAKVQKQRKKTKLVLESAGAKDDDKLRVVLSFHANPPPGFTFIPAGNTQLTAALKAFAKRGGQQIMAVSATPHAARHELSREVHRIGYHFPTEVVDQVCSHYGIRLDDSGRIVGEQDNERIFMKISQKGEVVLNENIRDQVTINTEAKEIIRDLFPKIPDNDLFQIIKTAFQLGDKKVGTAEEIPLVRRAQLSVVAHIRHSYTNYDKLLRQVPYNDARHMVEKTTLRKLVEWRGDENEQSEASRKAVDEAVREVVVLSDEEESDSEPEEGQILENDDLKVEPTKRPPRPEVITQHRPVSPGDQSSGEEAPNGYRYVHQASRRNPVANQEADSYNRQQQTRYALWDQVRHEYRNGIPTQEAPRVLARIPIEEPSFPRYSDVIYEQPPGVRYVVADQPPIRPIRQPSPPQVFQGPDGRYYERVTQPLEISGSSKRIHTPLSRHLRFSGHDRRSASPSERRTLPHRRTPSNHDGNFLVPSIEPPDQEYQSPSLRNGTFSNQRNLIDLTSSAEQATERMRLSESPPPSPFKSLPPTRTRDVQMLDRDDHAVHRRIIDLTPQLPSASSGRHEAPVAYSRGQPDHHLQRADMYHSNTVRHERPLFESASQGLRPYADQPMINHRQVLYDSAGSHSQPSRQVRYVVEEQPSLIYREPLRQRYHEMDEHMHDQVMERYVRDGPRHYVQPAPVQLPAGGSPADPRQQHHYRTTYIQQ